MTWVVVSMVSLKEGWKNGIGSCLNFKTFLYQCLTLTYHFESEFRKLVENLTSGVKYDGMFLTHFPRVGKNEHKRRITTCEEDRIVATRKTYRNIIGDRPK